MLASHRESEPVDTLEAVITCDQIMQLRQAVRQVKVDESIYDYLLDLVRATRDCDELHVGVSTRGAICLYRGAQALALINTRDFVIPDDIKQLAAPVLAHRVIPKGYLHAGRRARGGTVDPSVGGRSTGAGMRIED